jgi:transposase
MFIRTKKFKKRNGKEYEYLYLVENYRNGDKVVQKTVMSFGAVNDPETKKRINDIVAALLGVHSDFKLFNTADQLSAPGTKHYGPLLIFKRLWKDLGIGKILKDSLYHYETFFDLSDCIFNMILSRLIEPCSKRGMLEFQKDVYDLPPFELHQYYRAMDYIIDNKEDIEKRIFDQMKSFSGARLDMAFFDTTTIIYFGDAEEDDDNKLLAKGFSKDHRGDLKQVVVGVVMSKDGIPLAHEVFSGNKNDVTCFKELIDKLICKFGIKKIILVGDRGMISMKNLKLLEENGLEYILGFRMRTIKKESRNEIFKKVDLKRLRTLNGLQAKEAEYQGKRLIVYFDEERAQLDKEHRESIIEELKEKTKNGTIHTIVSNINYKRYLDIEGKDPKISKKKVDLDELYDGVFVITSNTKLSPNQIVKSYRDLWHVEQGFRWLKSELEMGPIYHWKDRRIEAHIMICFLSLILKVFLNKKMKEADKKTSYPEAMVSLKRLKVVELEIDKKQVHLTTDIEPLAKTVFKAINMRPPEKILYDEYSSQANVVETILS